MNFKCVALEIWNPTMHFASSLSKDQLTQYNYQRLIKLLEQCDFFSLPMEVESEDGNDFHYRLIAETEFRRSAIHFEGKPKASNLKDLLSLYQDIWARQSPFYQR